MVHFCVSVVEFDLCVGDGSKTNESTQQNADQVDQTIVTNLTIAL